MIFSCLGASILRVFGRNRCKKGSLKKKQKRSKKRSTGQAAKTVSGGVGPCKTTKRNIRKVSKLDRWTKHAQTSLKARWRIIKAINTGPRAQNWPIIGTRFSEILEVPEIIQKVLESISDHSLAILE